MYEKVTLDNGLRLITAAMPATRSVAINFFIGTGSRYENDAEAGVSHFIEHMCFKGTSGGPLVEQTFDDAALEQVLLHQFGDVLGLDFLVENAFGIDDGDGADLAHAHATGGDNLDLARQAVALQFALES